MNSRQLEQCLLSDSCTSGIFHGVFAANKLPKYKIKRPYLVIANTDPDYKPGAHWVLIYQNEWNSTYFFDSYGYPPTFYNSFFLHFLRKNGKEFESNKCQLQSFTSSFCGQWCLYVAYHLSRNLKTNQFLTSFMYGNPKIMMNLLNNSPENIFCITKII